MPGLLQSFLNGEIPELLSFSKRFLSDALWRLAEGERAAAELVSA